MPVCAHYLENLHIKHFLGLRSATNPIACSYSLLLSFAFAVRSRASNISNWICMLRKAMSLVWLPLYLPLSEHTHIHTLPLPSPTTKAAKQTFHFWPFQYLLSAFVYMLCVWHDWLCLCMYTLLLCINAMHVRKQYKSAHTQYTYTQYISRIFAWQFRKTRKTLFHLIMRVFLTLLRTRCECVLLLPVSSFWLYAWAQLVCCMCLSISLSPGHSNVISCFFLVHNETVQNESFAHTHKAQRVQATRFVSRARQCWR